MEAVASDAVWKAVTPAAVWKAATSAVVRKTVTPYERSEGELKVGVEDVIHDRVDHRPAVLEPLERGDETGRDAAALAASAANDVHGEERKVEDDEDGEENAEDEDGSTSAIGDRSTVGGTIGGPETRLSTDVAAADREQRSSSADARHRTARRDAQNLVAYGSFGGYFRFQRSCGVTRMPVYVRRFAGVFATGVVDARFFFFSFFFGL